MTKLVYFPDANMVASRYIVMEVGDGDACNNLKPVTSVNNKNLIIKHSYPKFSIAEQLPSTLFLICIKTLLEP
jgi:hypothetical protein